VDQLVWVTSRNGGGRQSGSWCMRGGLQRVWSQVAMGVEGAD
jgi:hypothetical protein